MDHIEFIIIKMIFEDEENINGDGNLTFQEIYYRSKKNDDYEKYSIAHTELYAIELKLYLPRFNTKRMREKVFRLIWCGLKVAFLLNPAMKGSEFIFTILKEILSLKDPKFNQAFFKYRDLEMLNYKNPDRCQARIINACKALLKMV